MAGPIRQQIDIAALERYIDKNVPEIKTPLDVKQVLRQHVLERLKTPLLITYSLDMVNRIQHTCSPPPISLA